MAQAFLDLAVSRNLTEILFGANRCQFFSNVIPQPGKHNRDVASLEGPRQPARRSSRGDVRSWE